MYNTRSEEWLAKSAYNWLRISPLFTITTLYIVASLGIGESICYIDLSLCDYHGFGFYITIAGYINIGLGVLVSACWHLILLQYANNKDSEFVRRHGKQALIYAGVRTAVALFGVVADFLLNTDGGVACIAIIILLILWFALPNLGMGKIKKELEADLNISREDFQIKPNISAEVISNEAIDIAQEKAEEKKINTMENKQSHQEILDSILTNLKSSNDANRKQAIEQLREINFSSPAIRSLLEKMSLQDSNSIVRKEALKALSLPSNQAVQKHLIANQLDRGTRFTILNEIKKWVSEGLLNEENAEVIQRRYDFDFIQTPQAASQPASVQQKISQPEKISALEKPAEPAQPAPTLLQTLTSEASVKVYLYLGAFFVIAAAAILGAVIPELRLPILIIGTLLFGGLSIAIKKRLPQPSFALFIVFSFLLPITANSIELTLRETLGYESFVTSIYWAMILFVMSGIWAFGAKLYDSRLFSVTAYSAFVLALFNLANAFDTEPEIYTLFGSIAALSGLAGAWLIKKWKDANFALPIFLSSQLAQLIVLFVSLSIFSVKIFDPANSTLWHLIPFFVWLLASAYYVVSDKLYPFVLFAWATAASLIPIPFFLAATLDLESLGSTILLLIWGIFLSVASEVFNRIESVRKYSLPFLLASFPSFITSLVTGFVYEIWLGMVAALVIAILFTALHILRARWQLWIFALVNFVIAYFAFFQIGFIKNLNIYLGYQILAIGLLFLTPDLFLKKDWNDSPEHRLPVRIFGVTLSVAAVIFAAIANESSQAAICFAVLTLFTIAYALAYQSTWLAYIPATALLLTIFYTMDAFKFNDSWLPIFTGLTFLYFIVGMALYKKENWSFVFRNAALTLGSIISFIALTESNQVNGWFVFAIGFLFIVEMVLRKNGFFEIGAPIFFSAAAFLIMQDFEINTISTQLLVHSVVWIFADILAHLFYKHPRPFNMIIRGIGGLIALVNYGLLFTESDLTAALCFAIYALLWLTVSLLYKTPTLFYAFTLTVPIFATFLFRNFAFDKWIHPVIMIAFAYYCIGFVLRGLGRLKGWDSTLLYSGLGLGVFVSLASPIVGGVDASIPVAVAATLWAVEAFSKKSAGLALPANGLYLMSYFILLNELDVQEVQFFSMGAALIGLIQHYLLTRSESKSGAFVMGMLSQFVLLGTTYIEMISKNDLTYFFLLFLQSLAVLIYGLVIRSRSLTFFPIGFVVLGVITVVYSALKDVGAIFLIGCTGILLLGLGILAVLLRERIAKLGEKLSDWQA